MKRQGQDLISENDGQPVGGWAGFVSARRNRQSGALIVVIDDRSGAWSSDSLFVDDDGKTSPWWTMCDRHSTMVQHRTRALAEWHASDPTGWCEGCSQSNDYDPD